MQVKNEVNLKLKSNIVHKAHTSHVKISAKLNFSSPWVEVSMCVDVKGSRERDSRVEGKEKAQSITFNKKNWALHWLFIL